jgi:hypothetical protein
MPSRSPSLRSLLTWSEPTWAERRERHRRLRALDRLLYAVEEHNLSAPDEPLDQPYIDLYRRLGGKLSSRQVRDGAAMIEAVFELQEPYLRIPEIRQIG